MKPACGAKKCGGSSLPKIQLTSRPACVRVIESELALVVLVPGLGLVIAEAMGAFMLSDPATAKKCTNIGSWMPGVTVIVVPAGHDAGFWA